MYVWSLRFAVLFISPSSCLPFSLGRIDPKGREQREEGRRDGEAERGSSCTTLVGLGRAGQGISMQTMSDEGKGKRFLCNHTGFELA